MDILVFDFGGTSVKYGIWTDNHMISGGSFPTPTTWEALESQLLSLKGDYGKSYSLQGVAFSFPGAVDSKAGIIHNISAIPYLQAIPLQDKLEQLLGLPAAIENDANCAALAELWLGAAKCIQNVLFVVIGTGVGGVVIFDGKVHPGKHFFGGEFGVMEFGGGLTFSTAATAVSMAKRYCNHLNVAEGTYSGKDVFDFAAQGDEIALKEVEDFHHYLALGIYNLQASFDPDMILIGGGISANDKIIHRVQEDVNALFKERNYGYIQPVIKACQFRNEANLIGAVKNFLDR